MGRLRCRRLPGPRPNPFPEWREHLTYKSDPYLDGAHTLNIPSANPSVITPLTLTVATNEVLMSWFEMWHLHIFRYQDAGQGDKSHLDRPLKEIEDFVEERIVAAEQFQDGSCRGGGSLRVGEGIPENWKETALRFSEGKLVSIITRSWRGAHDEEWHSEDPSRRFETNVPPI